MKTRQTTLPSILVTAMMAIGSAISGHGALLVYEPFDYPAGTNLLNRTNGLGFAGAWIPGGFNAEIHDLAVMRAGPMAYPGLAVTGAHHLRIAPSTNGIFGLTRILAASLNEPGTACYLSFLHRPDGDEQYSAVVLGGGSGAELSVGKSGTVRQYHVSQRGGRRRVYSDVEPVVGKTVFLVLKAEFREGPDKFTLYVNPVPGQPEPAKGAVKEDLDLQYADGVTLYSMGAWSVDELRVGTTWADVTPAARAAGGGVP